ncbi:MAG: hypothetical protein SNJ29_10210 [Rikenellaceae bacterium]
MENKNAKVTSLKELAVMAYNLPVNSDIEFSCEEDSNFWAIRKINIFDGEVLLIGSLGGGLTCSLDMQVDGGSEEVEDFFANVLQDYAVNVVYVDQGIKSTYWSRIEDIGNELRDEIKKIMQDNNLTVLDFTKREDDKIYVVWFNNDGEPFDTPVVKIECENDSLFIEAALENVDFEDFELQEIETISLNRYDLAQRNVSWLAEILDAVKELTSKTE